MTMATGQVNLGGRASTPLPSGPAPLSEASRRLRETVLREAARFDEYWIWFAESLRRTRGEPFREIRVAQAVAHLFANMPIAIRAGERLVGWHPNTPAGERTAEAVRQARQYAASQECWRAYICEGHLAPDYETILRLGLTGVRRQIDERAAALDPNAPETAEKRVFYEAARIAIGAVQAFIRRYADLAASMARSAEDPRWADELRTISQVCQRIADHPPRTFREAIQLTWFVLICVAMESGTSHGCFGPGRMDQYLFRFYEEQSKAGTLDEELVDDLLGQFFIKCNEFEPTGQSALILTAGGRRPDGADATNALSFKMLETADRVRMYFPGVDVLWHADIRPDFMSAAVRLLRNGKGQPSFFNSDLIVKGLTRRGIPFDHAVDHLPSTCTETSIMGRSNPNVAWPYINVPMILLYALYAGSPATGRWDTFPTDLGWGPNAMSTELIPERWTRAIPSLVETPPQSLADLKDAFARLLGHVCAGVVAKTQSDLLLQSVHRPFPLLSCFVQGCLERGRNISAGGALYNFAQPEGVGISNVVDGLAAIETLVRQQGRYTLDDFRVAMKADFEGHDELRNAIIRECPKHGNDVGWVNDLFAEVAGAWCAGFEGRTNFLGGPFLPGFLGWIVWIHFGQNTPATPDGRKAGTPLANSMAHCAGVRPKGFPALVLSTTGFDQSRGLGGTTFNVRFQADSLADEKGADGLGGLIEAAFDLGLYQLQVEVTGTATLHAAMENPDAYADLFVRIGGYLVPFTTLPRDAQEEVIGRAEMGL